MDIAFTDGALYLGKITESLGAAIPVIRVKLAGEEEWHESQSREAPRSDKIVIIEHAVNGTDLVVRIQWIPAIVRDMVDEVVTIVNEGESEVRLDQLDIGLEFPLPGVGWSLVGIPFRISSDGLELDASMAEVQASRVRNSRYVTDCIYWPEACDGDALRSEAWFIGSGTAGLLVAKHNPRDIEYSMAEVRDGIIRLGGAGFCLFHEPRRATILKPKGSFTFGFTRYTWVDTTGEHARTDAPGEAAMEYCRFLEAMGHGIPNDYNPPVHWNELYDVGWYHSDPDLLAANYTKDALNEEVEKAKACHCEALYLDPGWEIAEGTTMWDEGRLGPVGEFAAELADKQMSLSFRTVLRDYSFWLPDEWLVVHDPADLAPVSKRPFSWPMFREGCLINPAFRAEKLDRVLKPILAGASFVMVDEHDWRGPCHDTEHGHPDPSNAADHVTAVYDYCATIRERCRHATGHDVLLEVHDPVWSWGPRYCPVYYRQGFDEDGAYQENWGFEFMWNPIADLRSGKALSLYYYACACPIPLYLHITMSHDNDRCLFFWWVASTVRHVGIGGKTCNPTLCPSHNVHDFDQEAQFERYAAAMEEYQAHKVWFVQGRFIGIQEDVHVHVIEGVPGVAIVLFNLEFDPKTTKVLVPWSILSMPSGSTPDVIVVGARQDDVAFTDQGIQITIEIDAEASARVYIGTRQT
jgi:hypothetical protein